jgi:hypothetical protein
MQNFAGKSGCRATGPVAEAGRRTTATGPVALQPEALIVQPPFHEYLPGH